MILLVHLDFFMPEALDGFLTKLTDVSTTNHSTDRAQWFPYKIMSSHNFYSLFSTTAFPHQSLVSMCCQLNKMVFSYVVSLYVVYRVMSKISNIFFFFFNAELMMCCFEVTLYCVALDRLFYGHLRLHESNWKNGFWVEEEEGEDILQIFLFMQMGWQWYAKQRMLGEYIVA